MQDQLKVSANESTTTVVAVSGSSARTFAGFRELIRAAESAGVPDDALIESVEVSGSRIELEVTRVREFAVPDAERAPRVPSALEIADALRAGTGPRFG